MSHRELIAEMVDKVEKVLTADGKRPWKIAQELCVPDDGLLYLALQQAVKEGRARQIIKEVPKSLGIPSGVEITYVIRERPEPQWRLGPEPVLS